jgi:hypothetical protein
VRHWQKYQRVINPLGEVGTVVRRIDGSCVKVRYDNGQTGIAYDSALIKPWPEYATRRPTVASYGEDDEENATADRGGVQK